MDTPLNQICRILPQPLSGWLAEIPKEKQNVLREIRLHAGQPIILQFGTDRCFLSGSADYRADEKLIQAVFLAICRYGVHTQQNRINQGFVTLPGGHRAGLSGVGVFHHGELTALREIGGINIRVAHEVHGAADEILRRWQEKGNLLVIGPPASGKTTVLRDLARQLGGSAGCFPRKITLIDERGELADWMNGKAQLQVGLCTDVITGIPKSMAVEMAVRTLSPDLIICDELGEEDGKQAILAGSNAGVLFAASAHAGSLEQLCRKPMFCDLLKRGMFSCLAFLDKAQTGRLSVWMEREAIRDEMDRLGFGRR